MSQGIEEFEIRGAYSPRKRVQYHCCGIFDPETGEEREGSLVVQSAKDECDINKIVARFTRGESITHVNRARPLYGDFSEAGSLMEAIQRVEEANRAFAELPAKVRDRVGNSPTEFLEFMSDESNLDEWTELGLAVVDEPESAPKGAGSAAEGAGGASSSSGGDGGDAGSGADQASS